ncbi:MAG: ABC transporter permease [Ignavibacteriales bacterium]|nr:ABC transporter permease [Ignavibacteriales bacterium]
MKFLRVAKWEFLEKIKSKAFLISLILLPVIMVLFSVLPGFLVSRAEEKATIVGVVDETGLIAGPLAKRLDEKYKLPDGGPTYVLRNLAAEGGFDPGQLRSFGNRLVADGEIEGFFTIPVAVFDSGSVIYRAENVTNFRVLERFSRAIEEIVVAKRLEDRGYDPGLIKGLLTDVEVKPIKVNKEGGETETGFLETFFSAYVFIMMLMFVVLTSGQLLIRSVVEEKSNRVIEVLLSSCSANDLMVGKILGLSGLGIFQLLIWGVIGLAISLKFGSTVFTPENFLISLVYFLLGYLLYSAIFVGAGSPVTTEQEAQQITTYVSLTLVFPIVLAVPAMQNPDSTLIKVLSYVPLLTPAFMLLRIPIQMPPAWEIMMTIGILIVSTIVCMWAAGKIFRVAILVYGKRPTVGELIHWIRSP